MRKALVVVASAIRPNHLPGAVNDANAMKAILETHGASTNFGVILLTSPGTTVDRGYSGAVEELFAGDCDVALLYFSGHGH